MQGDIFTKDTPMSRLIQLNTQEWYLPVNTRAEIYYKALPGKLISCVIAASVNQHGHVSVVEGGYRTKKVLIRYMTENGKSDIFFVFIQAAKTEPVSVEKSVMRSSSVDLVYEPMKNWTLTEIQDALRNADIFPL